MASKISLNKSVAQSEEDFKNLQRPANGMVLLCKWIELLPLPQDTLAFVANNRSIVKNGNTLFSLPKVFFKQFKLYRAGCAAAQKATFQRVKNLFTASLAFGAAAAKLPLLLDRIGIVDLAKISRRLPDKFEKATTVLSLIKYSVKWVEIAALLARHPRQALWVKWGATTLKIGSTAALAAALFMNLYLPPVALAALSTGTFSISLATHLAKQASKSKQTIRSYALLIN